MKKESLIGFCLFASFLYGINNILKITFNVKDKTKSETKSETNDQQTETDELLLEGPCRSELQLGKVISKTNYDYDDLDKIDILINEINIIEFEEDKEDKELESENERVFTINNMIDKKKYLIELNDKLTDIKTSLTNLKNEMEFCNSTTVYL